MLNENQYKVRLSAINANTIEQIRQQTVVFQVTPELVESRNINYKSHDPVHAPGQIFVYQNTNSRTFQLSNIKLISRTRQEASENLAILWTLRGWCMPTFGQTAPKPNLEQPTIDRSKMSVREMINQMSQTNDRFLGAPPPTLQLTAYSGSRGTGHLSNVPVVITQISIPYPSDTDYIPTNETHPTPMPSVMTIDLQLSESHSPNEYEKFDLHQFKTGNLNGF